MDEYAAVFVTGTLVADAAKRLLEQGLVLAADRCDRGPIFLKNGKAKLGMEAHMVILTVRRPDLARVVEKLAALLTIEGAEAPRIFAVPVIAAHGLEGTSARAPGR